MVEIGISRVGATGEYRVFWLEGGRRDDSKTYYTDDYDDALLTAEDTIKRVRDSGREVFVPPTRLNKPLLGFGAAQSRRYG